MSAAIQSNLNYAPVRRTPWFILVLMIVSVAINYIDRGSLSTAAPLLAVDMKLRPAQLGLLLSAFFWTYVVFQISSGWLVDHYDVKWIMALGFFTWSLATAATGFAHSFGALVAFRLLLGVGESVAYPCYSKIICAHFPETQRGLANGSIDAGTKIGPALGMLAGGTLMARYGWRPVFIVLGLGSLLWLPAWCKWVPRGRDAWQAEDSDGHGFAEILRQRPFWATLIGHFCGNYFWYFLLTWLPYYLVAERGFSMNKMSGVSAVTYCATGLSTIAAGRLADRAIAAGAAPTRVRRTCATLGLAFATIVIGVAFVRNSAGAMAILIASCMSYGVFASCHFAIPQTIAGPATAGKWTGLQNSLANTAGIIAPAITGQVVGKTGHFFWAFAASATVVLIGAAAYAFLLGPVEPLPWPLRKRSEGMSS